MKYLTGIHFKILSFFSKYPNINNFDPITIWGIKLVKIRSEKDIDDDLCLTDDEI